MSSFISSGTIQAIQMAPYASTIIRKPNQPKISPSLTRKESFTTTSPYKLKRLQMQNKEQELQNQ